MGCPLSLAMREKGNNMIDLTISDENIAVLFLLLAVIGACALTTLFLDLCNWLLTRKHKRKYQVTYVVHCDVLSDATQGEESSQ